MGNLLYATENDAVVKMKIVGPFYVKGYRLKKCHGGPLLWRLYFEEDPQSCFFFKGSNQDFLGCDAVDIRYYNHINSDLHVQHRWINVIERKNNVDTLPNKDAVICSFENSLRKRNIDAQ